LDDEAEGLGKRNLAVRQIGPTIAHVRHSSSVCCARVPMLSRR
jgi:hypothetical protein